jgi:hypothetical protein
VLAPSEIMSSLDWMLEAQTGWLEKRREATDWSSLTPVEREIMIAAKRIQDRLVSDFKER